MFIFFILNTCKIIVVNTLITAQLPFYTSSRFNSGAAIKVNHHRFFLMAAGPTVGRVVIILTSCIGENVYDNT